MKQGLISFTLNDQHIFFTRNGVHNSDDLKLRQVFSINDNKKIEQNRGRHLPGEGFPDDPHHRDTPAGLPSKLPPLEDILLHDRLFTVVVWMFVEVLIGSRVLVEQDDNSALSFALDPVDITTLHVVCDTVSAGIAVATDQ